MRQRVHYYPQAMPPQGSIVAVVLDIARDMNIEIDRAVKPCTTPSHTPLAPNKPRITLS